LDDQILKKPSIEKYNIFFFMKITLYLLVGHDEWFQTEVHVEASSPQEKTSGASEETFFLLSCFCDSFYLHGPRCRSKDLIESESETLIKHT
jgi:hypothetical protein